jgi:hypothetical protein
MKKQHPSILTVACISVIAIAFAAFWEVGVAVCASATIFIGYGLFCTLILLPLLLWKASWPKYVCYALMILSLGVLYFVPWNSRKPFLRDFEKIRIGMTLSEVEMIMGDYIKGTGWQALRSTETSMATPTVLSSDITMKTSDNPSGELEIQDTIVYRHSNEGAYNSDWGVVKFEDGKVVGKTFLPD